MNAPATINGTNIVSDNDLFDLMASSTYARKRCTSMRFPAPPRKNTYTCIYTYIAPPNTDTSFLRSSCESRR